MVHFKLRHKVSRSMSQERETQRMLLPFTHKLVYMTYSNSRQDLNQGIKYLFQTAKPSHHQNQVTCTCKSSCHIKLCMSKETYFERDSFLLSNQFPYKVPFSLKQAKSKLISSNIIHRECHIPINPFINFQYNCHSSIKKEFRTFKGQCLASIIHVHVPDFHGWKTP